MLVVIPMVKLKRPKGIVGVNKIGILYFSTTSYCFGNNIKPAVVYTNPDTQKLQILKENKNKSGVYRWINKETGKSYVGSAVNLSKRFSVYYSLNSIVKI